MCIFFNSPATHKGLMQTSVCKTVTIYEKYFSITQKPTQAVSITNSIYNSRPYYRKAKAINAIKLFFHLPLKLGNICPGFYLPIFFVGNLHKLFFTHN